MSYIWNIYNFLFVNHTSIKLQGNRKIGKNSTKFKYASKHEIYQNINFWFLLNRLILFDSWLGIVDVFIYFGDKMIPWPPYPHNIHISFMLFLSPWLVSFSSTVLITTYHYTTYCIDFFVVLPQLNSLRTMTLFCFL